MTDVVRYEREGPVAWVTIDRPEARNSINAEVRQGLFDAAARFNDDDAAVLVLTGAGDVAFCAGAVLLSQMCDLCVAADHARFAITEVKVGRGAPWAAPLPWLVPPRIAMELLGTCEPLSAA